MTIRTRLTLLFGLIVSGLLLVFCLLIYLLAERYRRSEFRERLRAEALASGDRLLGRQTVSPELLTFLDKNQLTVLHQEEIIVYDYRNKIVYESGTDYLAVPAYLLDRVRLEKEAYWESGRREVAGIFYTDPLHRMVVLASAVDRYGFSKMRHLAFLLSTGWGLMSLLVLVAGWLYAGRSLRPLKRIVAGVDEITASRLGLRLPQGAEQDELAQLSHRFNRMLDRLEDAFYAQKAFVSHASHELRTPLTAITGQIQVALLAKDDPAQLHAMLESVLEDVRDMTRLTNGLLTLASLNTDRLDRDPTPVPLDELVWQTRTELLKAQPAYQVRVQLQDGGAGWYLDGSEVLLRTALLNLMENGCKFSPGHAVEVTLASDQDAFEVVFRNAGAGLPAHELPGLFKPFQRGSNARQVPGHGIGLSLTDRIVRLHQGRLTVDSADTETVFTVRLPRRADRPDAYF